MNITGINILTNSSFIIPQLLILAACIYYLTKKTTIDGILLFISTLIRLLISTFQLIIMPYLMDKNVISSYNSHFRIITYLSPISVVASLAFAIGLFILIYNVVNKRV